MSEEQNEQDGDSRKAQAERLRNGETALIPMPGEPGTLAELNVNDLRQQLAHQGLHLVNAKRHAVLQAMAALSEADLRSCLLSYLRPALMAAVRAELVCREGG